MLLIIVPRAKLRDPVGVVFGVHLSDERMYKLHSQWFKLSVEKFEAVQYAEMAV